jgi:hypothetical protein
MKKKAFKTVKHSYSSLIPSLLFGNSTARCLIAPVGCTNCIH